MHFYHHTHPEKIFASKLARKVSIVTAVICIGSGLYISPELFLLSGIVTGIAVYLHMHAWLHQPWAARRLKKLQNAHMQHHCGGTEKYFGVVTTFWDHLFNTTGNEETKITIRKKDFYFTRTTSLAKSA